MDNRDLRMIRGFVSLFWEWSGFVVVVVVVRLDHAGLDGRGGGKMAIELVELWIVFIYIAWRPDFKDDEDSWLDPS